MKVEFETDNDAYQNLGNGDVDGVLVADTLREIANKIESGEVMGSVRDPNGNTVGYYRLY